MAALRKELDHDYEAAVGLDTVAQRTPQPPKLPADLGLDRPPERV